MGWSALNLWRSTDNPFLLFSYTLALKAAPPPTSADTQNIELKQVVERERITYMPPDYKEAGIFQ